MKRVVAAVITASLLAVALWAGRGGFPTPAPAAASPAECIAWMFDAAGRGDVPAYLACFTGPERARLERQLGDQSQAEFARALVAAVSDLKGRAVVLEQPPDGPRDRCRATVERIYANRTDRQTYELLREDSGWRIHSVTPTASQQPDKAYGTPVWE